RHLRLRGGGRVHQLQRLRCALGAEDRGEQVGLVAVLRAEAVVAAVDRQQTLAEGRQCRAAVDHVGRTGQLARRGPLLAVVARGNGGPALGTAPEAGARVLAEQEPDAAGRVDRQPRYALLARLAGAAELRDVGRRLLELVAVEAPHPDGAAAVQGGAGVLLQADL